MIIPLQIRIVSMEGRYEVGTQVAAGERARNTNLVFFKHLSDVLQVQSELCDK